MPVMLIVGAAIVLFAAVWTLLNLLSRSRFEGTHARPPVPGQLAYVVPEGQDPAVLVAELSKAGFASQISESAGQRRVLVSSDDQRMPDRGKVREVIARTGTVIDTPAPTSSAVYFEDEAAR